MCCRVGHPALTAFICSGAQTVCVLRPSRDKGDCVCMCIYPISQQSPALPLLRFHPCGGLLSLAYNRSHDWAACCLATAMWYSWRLYHQPNWLHFSLLTTLVLMPSAAVSVWLLLDVVAVMLVCSHYPLIQPGSSISPDMLQGLPEGAPPPGPSILPHGHMSTPARALPQVRFAAAALVLTEPSSACRCTQ